MAEATETTAVPEQGEAGVFSAAPSETASPATKEGETPAASPTAAPPQPDLTAELAKLTASYKELQGHATRSTQSNAELRKQIAELAEVIQQATRAPHDPEKFMEELKQHPDKVFERFFKPQLEALRKSHEDAVAPLSSAVDALTVDKTVLQFRADKEGHPDFEALEGDMKRIIQTPGLAPDIKLPPAEYTEALYQRARLLHSQDALKLAEEEGRKKERTALATESRTTVAGGGKQAAIAPTDPSKMTAAQTKEWFEKNHPEMVDDGY